MIASQLTEQDVSCEEPSWSRIEVVQTGGVSRMVVNESLASLVYPQSREFQARAAMLSSRTTAAGWWTGTLFRSKSCAGKGPG